MESAGKKSERLIQLELLLISHPEGMRRAEIARRLEVHRATVGRYIDELSGRIPIWERDYRVGIESEQIQELTRMGLLESLTIYMALKGFAERFKSRNPMAASAVRKLAGFMKGYAPFISLRMNEIADSLDSAAAGGSEAAFHNLERLGEAWISGKKVRLSVTESEKTYSIVCSIFSLRLTDNQIDIPPVEVVLQEKGRTACRAVGLASIGEVEILLEDGDEAPDSFHFKPGALLHRAGRNLEPCTVIVHDRNSIAYLKRIARGAPLIQSVDGSAVAVLTPVSLELLYGAIFASRGTLQITSPQAYLDGYLDLLESTRSMLDDSLSNSS